MKLLDGAGNYMSEKENKKEQTKRIVFIILGVLLLIGSVLVVSFAIFVFEDMSNHYNSITTGTTGEETLFFSYNEDSNGIDLENAVPLADEIGKKLVHNNSNIQGVNQGYFDFSIRAGGVPTDGIKYQIYATVEEDSDMDPDFMKIYLTDEQDNALEGYKEEVPLFSNLEEYAEENNSKLIYEGTITEKVTQRFRLRLWIAKDYTDGSTSKTFKIKINVKATA